MSFVKHIKRDSGFGESLSLGDFSVYLGLSHEKKTKESQVFIENFSNKKLEEIFPKKSRKFTHDVYNVKKTCDCTPFSSYLGLDTRNTNKNPIIIKSHINTDDSSIPLPSATKISINRNLQLIREVKKSTFH
jgi:hypothetical protein